MASKENLKTRAARVREEMRRTGRLVVRAPLVVRLAECLIRLLLGALLGVLLLPEPPQAVSRPKHIARDSSRAMVFFIVVSSFRCPFGSGPKWR